MAVVKIGNTTTTFVADQARTTYQLALGKVVDTDNYGIDVLGGAKGRSFEIAGTVDATGIALQIGTASESAAPVEVTLMKSALLTSDHYGFKSYGNGHVVHNAGDIHGLAAGMEVHGSHTIVNSGTIDGGYGINIYSGDGDLSVVKNSGHIGGTVQAIYGSDVVDKIINTGSIAGDVYLSGGDDICSRMRTCGSKGSS